MEFLFYLLIGVVAYFWWNIFTKKATDTYDSGYSFMWVIWTPMMIIWCITLTNFGFAFFHDTKSLSEFIILSYFGPFTLLLGILKAVGFGNTRLGQHCGFAKAYSG